MKKTIKFLALLTVLSLAISFVACSSNKADDINFGEETNNSQVSDNYDDDGHSNVISNISGLERIDEEKEDSLMEEVDAGEKDSLYVWKENEFIKTEDNNVSTFSADVDTASYTYFRKLVNQGYGWSNLVNSANSFRTEEFINYFKYNVEQPRDNELFGVTANIVDCPWNEEAYVLRLTLQAKNAIETEGNNLVFLIDVSGSMSSQDKLPLLKKAFSNLVGNLTEKDRVSIVTYSGKEQVVLDGCEGNKSEQIMSAINALIASGSTNGEAGLTEAYRIAEKNYIEGGNNRIIMASDGDLNVGISSADELKNYIEQKRGQGVYLSVLGFGTGNYRDTNMETIADCGNGVYYYIDGESEAERVFGTDILGTLYTVADDVKMQLTFDGDYVSSYRLIGYENRILSKEDFVNDKKDAGDVGASHQVTVCYEIILTDSADMTSEASRDVSWINLAVRYKNPGESISLLNEYEIGSGEFTEADEDIRFLLCVIEASMLLHHSQYIGDQTLEGVTEDLRSLDLSQYTEREEFLALLEIAAQ